MSDFQTVIEHRSARTILRKLNRAQAAALVELLYVLVATDDEISDDEMDEVKAQLCKLSFHWAKDEREVHAMVAQAWQLGSSFDNLDHIKSYISTLVEQLPEGELRLVVFHMATFVCAADGIAPSEGEVLTVLRQALGVSEAQSLELAERLKRP